MIPRLALLAYGLDRPLTGIGRYTLELARALHAHGAQLTLLLAGGRGPLPADIPAVSLPGCRRLPGLLTLGQALLPWLARRLRLDVLHDPTGVTPLLFGLGGAAPVVTVHDVFTWSLPGYSTLLDTLIYRRWLPRVLPRRARQVITDSQASRADLVRYLRVPAERVRAIPLGVSSHYHPPASGQVAALRARLGLPERYLLFVGSLEPRKNLARLLQACARLDPPVPLVAAGIPRPGLPPGQSGPGRVILPGHVPEADLPALYGGAELFVYPSLAEGFGLPPLEAMACGTPVVASDAASLPEVVGEAALMVDPYNVDALAEAMRRALAEPELRAELRRRGLERARQFTWERTARETMEVYRRAVEEDPHP